MGLTGVDDKPQSASGQGRARWTLDDISTGLNANCENIAIGLLGPANPKLSRRNEMRWGPRGGTVLRIAGGMRGSWFDHVGHRGGGMLQLIEHTCGVDFAEACEIAKRDFLPYAIPPRRHARMTRPQLADNDADKAGKVQAALRLWHEGQRGSPLAAKYLFEHRQLRGISAAGFDFNHCLRWHAGQQAIVALMLDPLTGQPTGIHRTFLNDDGSKRERKMLGKKGVICLSPHEDITYGLGICEGLEDGLALLLAGCGPVWVACDAGGITAFPVLAGVDSLTIFADNDDAGMTAARECTRRWLAVGRDARIVFDGGQL